MSHNTQVPGHRSLSLTLLMATVTKSTGKSKSFYQDSLWHIMTAEEVTSNTSTKLCRAEAGHGCYWLSKGWGGGQRLKGHVDHRPLVVGKAELLPNIQPKSRSAEWGRWGVQSPGQGLASPKGKGETLQPKKESILLLSYQVETVQNRQASRQTRFTLFSTLNTQSVFANHGQFYFS